MNTTEEKLRAVVRVLRGVPRERFYMFTWKCGTTACAIGHCAADPEFAEAGLRIGEAETKWKRTDGQPVLYPVFGDFVGFEAVSEFFGVSAGAVIWLFHTSRYPSHPDDITTGDVIERVEKFIEDNR